MQLLQNMPGQLYYHKNIHLLSVVKPWKINILSLMLVAYSNVVNFNTLTKEAYAIYVTVKRLSFYLAEAVITLQSNHLPLKRFLQKTILNAK